MHSMDHLKKLPQLKKNAKSATDAFWAYNNATMSDGTVPKKYKELIALGVALTTQCAYCLELHKKAAQEAGATVEEIAETIHVAAAIRAGGAITHGTHLLDS
ncbi:MAG: carboxymuconolactone decarboxylase family protein [Verrucomicrobiota bacterium]